MEPRRVQIFFQPKMGYTSVAARFYSWTLVPANYAVPIQMMEIS